jgi:hypothetical protein
MKPTFKLNTREFDATLKRYMALSKRTPKEVTDTKAFYIARRATLETPKAKLSDIKGDLGRIVNSKKKGRYLKLTMADRRPVSLAEAIIRARAHRKGSAQPTKEEIGGLIENLLIVRARSIAFLKSGWLPAIKALAPFAVKRGQPRVDNTAKQVGQAKGFGRPSPGGWRAKTVIANLASTLRDKKEALIKYGMPALQQAFDHETRSMKGYIEDKLRRDARAVGIKTR